MSKQRTGNGRKKQTRKRKSELVAPQCKENCQINHTIEQVAALLQCSPRHIERLLEAGRLPYICCGLSKRRKTRRIPHSSLRELVVSAA
jgi:excisionase family DNA binding protein